MKNENSTVCGQSVVVDLPTVKNGKNVDYYIKWYNIFRRCYNPTVQKKYPTYVGCSVCSEWHTLSVFKDWYYAQPNYGKLDMELDKDILIRGNKVYGPQYCRLVPHRINSLLIDHRSARGAFPVGVYFRKDIGKYMAQCCYGKKQKTLGCFANPDSAFSAYKKYKEQIIKSAADEYYSQSLIDADIYDALQNWIILK